MGISKPWVNLPQTMIVIGFFGQQKLMCTFTETKRRWCQSEIKTGRLGAAFPQTTYPVPCTTPVFVEHFAWENPTNITSWKTIHPRMMKHMDATPKYRIWGDKLWITSSEFQNKDYCTLIVFGQFQGSNSMRFASVSLRCDISKTFCRWQCETGWNRWNKAKWHCLNNQKETKETTME